MERWFREVYPCKLISFVYEEEILGLKRFVFICRHSYICRRCRDIGPFFWKISQYLGSGWHNWSPNVATVTGWTKCFTKEVPVLRDTLYKQSSLDQEQCWFMWNCLVTALGNLLIFPIDMYLIYVTVSVFYFAISLESLLSSSWSQS